MEIAAECDVSRQTLWEWRRQPAFREALEEYQSNALRDVRLRLTRLGEKACSTLESALDGDESAQKGVTAAREVLDRIGASFTPPLTDGQEPRELPRNTGNPWLPGEGET